MTSLAWETQLKLLKTSENLVVGLVTWEMCCEFFFLFLIFVLGLVLRTEFRWFCLWILFWNSRKIVGDINDNALAL